MIVSASYRTDVPAFWTPWFLTRLAAGVARVKNPYGGPDYEVSLRPGEVDAFVLWTRNLAPLLPHLERVREVAPFAVQFTITGYPRALESSVIEPERAVAQLKEVRQCWGGRAAVWRYDPILATSLTPPGFHRANFAALAEALRGTVDEVTVSWANLYRKTERNLAAAARRHGFTFHDPDAEEKRALLTDLAQIAAEAGMRMTLCTQPDLLVPGVEEARCVDADRLGVAAREKGNRPGCRCAESRDIGAYDTCPHGCTYCYAVSSRDRAAKAVREIDQRLAAAMAQR
jgi:hypothetical protein